MSNIKDYKCTYSNSVGISEEVTKGLKLEFPQAYETAEGMVVLAEALKTHDGAAVCEMPFCHTVEGEALGGIINLGNAAIGPRAAGYCCDSMEEVLQLAPIDFGRGRIYEVLKACKELGERGHSVVLDISGPFTVLNCLVDAPKVFKTLRKKPELAYQVMWRLGEEAIAFMKEAKKYGVRMMSYADSSGAVSILGPKVAEQVVENFTYEFMKRVESEVCDDNTLVLLCPKTAFALIGCDKAEFIKCELSGPMNYAEACIELIGKTPFVGQTCIKNTEHILSNGSMHVLKLK